MVNMIQPSTKNERDFIENKLKEYNELYVPVTKVDLGFNIKDSEGNIIGGITGVVYWKQSCLYIDIIWIDEGFTKKGLGTKLLNHIEQEAKKIGCCFSHLDTFDFQAKDFYIKNGYEVFGILDYPDGHIRYSLKKKLK